VARAFYALGDTTTPMKISMVCLTINFLAACLLMTPLKEGGPGVANTFTSAINVGLLLFALRKKLRKLELGPLRQTLLTLAPAALAAGIVAWAGWRWWEISLGHATLVLKLGAVFVPAGFAGGLYWSIAMICRVPAAREMTAFALAKFKK